MIILVISLPFTSTVIAGLLVSTTVGPSSGLEKNASVGAGFGLVTVGCKSSMTCGTTGAIVLMVARYENPVVLATSGCPPVV